MRIISPPPVGDENSGPDEPQGEPQEASGVSKADSSCRNNGGSLYSQPNRSFGRPFGGDAVFQLPEGYPREPQEGSGASKTDSSCRSSWGFPNLQSRRSFGMPLLGDPMKSLMTSWNYHHRRHQVGHVQWGWVAETVGRAGPIRVGSRRKREMRN